MLTEDNFRLLALLDYYLIASLFMLGEIVYISAHNILKFYYSCCFMSLYHKHPHYLHITMSWSQFCLFGCMLWCRVLWSQFWPWNHYIRKGWPWPDTPAFNFHLLVWWVCAPSTQNSNNTFYTCLTHTDTQKIQCHKNIFYITDGS